jgi:hypothetical protein
VHWIEDAWILLIFHSWIAFIIQVTIDRHHWIGYLKAWHFICISYKFLKPFPVPPNRRKSTCYKWVGYCAHCIRCHNRMMQSVGGSLLWILGTSAINRLCCMCKECAYAKYIHDQDIDVKSECIHLMQNTVQTMKNR